MSFANINLVGRIVSDPEMKAGKGSRKFCTFRVAVNHRYGGQESTSFFNCTGNEAMGDRIQKAGLTKGRLVHISGSFALREFKDRDGNIRTSADIGIQDWHYLDSKPKGDSAGAPSGSTAVPSAGVVHDESYLGMDDDLPI